jgi:predicted dehydrogenase
LTLKIVQVGVGGWGQDWYKNIITKSEDFELVAVVDVEPSMLACVQELGAKVEHCYSSIEQALESVESDAVLVTTTLPYHVPVALAALHAGRHVLTEKPFAPTIEEARQVIDLAAEKGLILMVSQNYRFFPAVRTVQALVRENRVGSIHTVNIDFRRYVPQNLGPKNRHYHLKQPLLMDMSIHHFDLMRGVLGQEPVEISCTTWNPAWSSFDEPPAGAATIKFDGGAVVSYRGSWISSGPATPWAGEWHIEGETGEINWTSRDNIGAGADRVSIHGIAKRARNAPMPVLEHIDRAGSLHAFAEAIQTGNEPETAGRDNIGSLALTAAAIQSATIGLPVRLPKM